MIVEINNLRKTVAPSQPVANEMDAGAAYAPKGSVAVRKR